MSGYKGSREIQKSLLEVVVLMGLTKDYKIRKIMKDGFIKYFQGLLRYIQMKAVFVVNELYENSCVEYASPFFSEFRDGKSWTKITTRKPVNPTPRISGNRINLLP